MAHENRRNRRNLLQPITHVELREDVAVALLVDVDASQHVVLGGFGVPHQHRLEHLAWRAPLRVKVQHDDLVALEEFADLRLSPDVSHVVQFDDGLRLHSNYRVYHARSRGLLGVSKSSHSVVFYSSVRNGESNLVWWLEASAYPISEAWFMIFAYMLDRSCYSC